MNTRAAEIRAIAISRNIHLMIVQMPVLDVLELADGDDFPVESVAESLAK